MRITLNIVAVLFLLVGAIWFLQGINAPWQFHDWTDSVGGLWRHRHRSRHHFVVGS